MNRLWAIGKVSDDLVDRLIESSKSSEPEKGELISGEVNQNIRKCIVNNISDKEILEDIMEVAYQSNKEFFGFDIDRLDDANVMTYDGKSESKYDWHMDCRFKSGSLYDRKLSMVIQLSGSEEYEGGDFQIECGENPDPEKMRQKGTLIIFPSFLYHRVTPVTSGVRKSFVSWVEGRQFR